MLGDKEHELKHHIKKKKNNPETHLSTILLGNGFAVEETIAPS